MEQVEGIDAGKVNVWFTDNVAGAAPPLAFELIAGGRSNLTFKVTDTAGHAWALRRPPTGHVLPTAHDMGREHRIISALSAGTDVPVATPVGFCDDNAVNGAPFYVMDFVEGHIIRDVASAKVLGPEQRRAASENLVDVLVKIHSVDVDAVGLGDLGRRDGYIERQLKRWYTQYEKSKMGQEIPLIDEMHDRLLAAVPAQQGSTIVHGDYRLDNTMLGDDGRLRAVLDWEICTLGDPLADVGLLLVYWTDPGDPGSAAARRADGARRLPAARRGGRLVRRTFGPRRVADRVLRGLRLLEAGLHPARGLRALRGRCGWRRPQRLRRVRRTGRAAVGDVARAAAGVA